MRDLVQFVRQLWEDRLNSVEEFTKENGLSVEEALKLRNQELEGCMKDLESQTDALLDALEEADSLLASPRKASEKLNRKLALGECLKRLGKQEEEASLNYDQEKVIFLQQARQLLIESFETDSPVLSEAEEDVEKEYVAYENALRSMVGLRPKTPTEEQMMQTDAAVNEEASTQTRRIILKKIRLVKQHTDGEINVRPSQYSPSRPVDRPPSPLKLTMDTITSDLAVAAARLAREHAGLPSSEAADGQKRRRKRRSASPRYINERLQIRAPSPRRRRLPWEPAGAGADSSELEATGGSSPELTPKPAAAAPAAPPPAPPPSPPPPPPPPVPPQPNNSQASLADPDAEDGFITADETFQTEKKQRTKRKSRSPQGKRKKDASKSPKRPEAGHGEAAAPTPEFASTRSSVQALEAPPSAADLGQGEGARPRRRRSKTQRSQRKSACSELPASSDDDEQGKPRRPTAEQHGDASRGPRRRSISELSSKQASPSRTGASRRPATSPTRRDDSPPRHDTSPRRRNASPQQRTASPPRHTGSPTRRTASQLNLNASPPRRTASRHNLNASPPRRTTSPHNLNASPPRRTTSRHNLNACPPRRTASPHNLNASPPRRTASPHNLNASPPRRNASRHNLNTSPSRRNASPPQKNVSPQRRTTSPARNTENPPRRTSSPPRYSENPPHQTVSLTRRTASPPRRTASPPRYAESPLHHATNPQLRGVSSPRQAGSPPRRMTNQVYQLTSMPEPEDPLAGMAAAAVSDSKLERERELGAKQRTSQARGVRRKRCCGGGDTMSVMSNSTEDSRGRPESARQLGRTPPHLLSHGAPPPPLELGAVGGDDPRHMHHNPAAGFPWDTSHLVYQPDPFCPGAVGGAAAEPKQDIWAYRMHQRDRDQGDMLPLGDGIRALGDGLATDDAKARQAAGDDSGFQSEPAARSLSSFRSEPYVPPLRLHHTPDSAARPKSESDMSFAHDTSAMASGESPQVATSRRSPRSPSRSRALTSAAPLERSNSCEVPHKKQRRTEERPSAITLQLTGSGDMAAPVRDRPQPAAAAEARPATLPPASEAPPPPPPTPSSPLAVQQTEQRAPATQPQRRVPPPAEPAPAEPAPAAAQLSSSAAGDSPAPSTPTSPTSPTSPTKTSDLCSSDFQECEPSPSQAPAATAQPPAAAAGTTISPTVLVKGYEQLQESLAELKELQTKFQKDFEANEHAKEMTVDLQADIQRLESSIQELQGIVSQEYEQTRQDHDETRAAITAIEGRVETGERSTQDQLDELRQRLEQITEKIGLLETEVKKDKGMRDKDALQAPNVVTLSTMLTRLETEVITLRREVDSNRVSLDSITSVTQLDSPKASNGAPSSDWQQTTRTDVTKGSAVVATPQDSLDTGLTDTLTPKTPLEQMEARAHSLPRPRLPEDLDSFRDSQSDLSGTELSLDDRPAARPRSPTPQQRGAADSSLGSQEPAAKAQSARSHRRRSCSQADEQRRPPAVSPLRMGRRRRSGSGHQPEVAEQLKARHRTPPRPRAAKRSRSAAPQGTREESDELRDYWGQDLSTASASTEPPLLDESTRAHHGSSRAPSRPGDGSQSQAKSAASTHNSEAFIAKIDAMVNPSDKLDYLQNKLLDLRHRVLLSMYRRQRRRAVSEGARGAPDQQRRRAQLAAIDRRLRQRIHGWNKRLMIDAGRTASLSSTGDVVSEQSSSGQSRGTLQEGAGGGSGKPHPPPPPQPTATTRRAATEYLTQLSHMLATGPDGAKRDGSRGRHRRRTSHSPPTKDPSSLGSTRRSGRRPPPPPPPVDMDGSQMQRFARNESKLAELQSYLGGIRQHLQQMALDLESPPPRTRAASGARGGGPQAPAPPPPAQGVVFAPWRHEQTARGRSSSRQRRERERRPTFAVPVAMFH